MTVAKAGHHKEHACRARKGGHDQLRAVAKAQHRGNHAREHQAHEEGEGQQHGHTSGGVLGLFNGEHEAKSAHHENDQAHKTCQACGNARGHTYPCAQYCGQQAQGQQPVGIAQHSVALLLRDAVACRVQSVNRVHGVFSPK